jgi:hypothetical protein
MGYLNVITLSDAKLYLRVDDTLTEDDTQITRMIEGALSFIEKWTNVLVFDRLKMYRLIDGCIRVYDYPINQLVDPVDATSERMTLYTTFAYGSNNSDLSLNVGFTNPADIPPELIDVAFELIDLMYYEHETGKSFRKDMSSLSIDMLNQNKRFIL